MARSETRKAERSASNGVTKVAVACQGGGMHAAFAVGVLKAILENANVDDKAESGFKLAGLSGTSAGALCALMAWYGLAPKKGNDGSGTAAEAIKKLEHFWQDFVARTGAETLLNTFTFGAFRAEELEVPLLGLSARVFGINPYAAGFNALAACLPGLGVRKQYFDLNEMLADTCPALKNDSIDWENVKTRVLVGASEVVNGFETVFDSDINKKLKKGVQSENPGKQDTTRYWRQQLPLSLEGVAASGTLPVFREAQRIGNGHYWDGLYSQNPPVREFISGPPLADVPDEIWIVRINPQQWPYPPNTNKDIEDRQNELMGNLSLNKELDAIMKVNEWISKYKGDDFAKGKKPVIIRTIKMEKETADELSYSSKFDRSRDRMTTLSDEGYRIALRWVNDWRSNKVGRYPEDAGYPLS
jgi:NTE family protein